MSNTIIKLLSIPLVLVSIIGCGGSKDALIPAPSKATLSFPTQNAACYSGTVISTTQSSVTFSWSASDNTDSYELDVKNLLTNTITTFPATTFQLSITLLRNTPYSWFIISKSSKTTTTATSDTWKFYNAGLGTVSHSPFPADVSSPSFGQNITATAGTVNLAWIGSDVDGDIVSYDVYFGTTTSPAILKTNTTNQFLNNVTVSSNTGYYWKVITKDSQGNTSDSGLFQFFVK